MRNYLTAGIGFSRLVSLVKKNSISIHPKYLFRFIFIAQSAIWSTLFSWIENKRYRKKISSTPVPKDPIFIIGHWRTGSTLLHQLLNLDQNLAAPTLFQVAEPDCFLSTYRYYMPVFSALLPDYRPMDNVKLGMDEPQEDEYAIYRMTTFSPIERLVFPENSHYFILDYPSFLPSNEHERKKWGDQLRFFFRKLHYFHGKTIISKNPFNSLRIKELVDLFPDARFIHITRHPYEVVPSTVHMWKIVMEQNKLNCKGAFPGIEEVAKGLDRILTTIKQDSNIIAKEHFYELKFEDLEADPVGEVRKIYDKFDLPFNDTSLQNIQNFMNGIKDFRKNEFILLEEERELIRNQLSMHRDFYYQM